MSRARRHSPLERGLRQGYLGTARYAVVSSSEGGPADRVLRGGQRRRLSRPARIGLGLLLTLVGLFFLVLLFPTAPGPLESELPFAAVGIFALWVGGILMGIGSRS
jgi:hypothetical protein